MESINKQIGKIIQQSKEGEIFLTSDFKDFGTTTAIRKSLSRFVELGIIDRMGKGIYVKPKQHKLFGKTLPSLEDVALILAKKEHVKIMPTGQYALNKIGLSNQVPTKLIFLTNGTFKKIQFGKSELIFRPTTSKKLAMIGEITSLLFLGLEELDLEKLTSTENEKIKTLIEKEDPEKLKHDLRLTPSKVSDFVNKSFLNRKQ
ncbi:MAG: type IV toxin-antitoxin system AbiEi family antitoxin domain-containing protein [Flavobacteriales bacterium]|nr:type IV toxin-antitoxin system AbiEi family antitoxin domain-containing protein [Flavobacteriales bacterium]